MEIALFCEKNQEFGTPIPPDCLMAQRALPLTVITLSKALSSTLWLGPQKAQQEGR